MRATLANLQITAAAAIAVAPTGPMLLTDAPRSLCAQANFSYGSGGTTVDAYLQTSVDGGLTWMDIAQWHFTTASARSFFNLNSQASHPTPVQATDGALAANTANDGILGPLFQVKTVSTGTYAGTTLRIDVSVSDR
jgi:hypothetical protein